MKSFVMIDKDEYDSQAHIPKKEYEKLVQECSKPITERAMFVYDRFVKMMREGGKTIRGEQLLEYLENRRPSILAEIEKQFPNA